MKIKSAATYNVHDVDAFRRDRAYLAYEHVPRVVESGGRRLG